MRSILVVDDNIDLLNIISSILEKNKFQVYKATSVQTALMLLDSNDIDAICSDFNMHDGTGLDLLEKLRHQNITIPFMLMSCIDDFRYEYEAKKLGGLFCCKTDHDLIAKIKAMF